MSFQKLNDKLLIKIFRSLPLDSRARMELVCERWSQLLRSPEFWTSVNFEGVTASVTASALAHIISCAQGTLRTLDITAPACDGITATGLLAALAPEGGASPAEELIELITWRPPAPGSSAFSYGPSRELTVAQSIAIRKACPALRSASVELKAAAESIPQAITALPSAGCPKRLSVRAFRTETQIRSFFEWIARQGDTSIYLDVTFESSNGGVIPFRAVGCEALAAALTGGSRLVSVAMPNNALGPGGAQALARALAANCVLTALDISSCDIGDLGAAHLGPALADNTSLTWLGLRSNGIGDKGAEVLASLLALNTPLLHLYLDRNGIGDSGVAALARGLFRNATVQTVSLGHNVFADAGAEGLARALAKPRPANSGAGLRTLNIHSTLVGHKGASAIADSLERNTSLRQLRLDNLVVGDPGAAALVRALHTEKNGALRNASS